MTQSDAAQALLIIENSEEPYLSGLIYNCIVPGKKYMSVEGLSGGEKTIAGFTLILAIQKWVLKYIVWKFIFYLFNIPSEFY